MGLYSMLNYITKPPDQVRVNSQISTQSLRLQLRNAPEREPDRIVPGHAEYHTYQDHTVANYPFHCMWRNVDGTYRVITVWRSK